MLSFEPNPSIQVNTFLSSLLKLGENVNLKRGQLLTKQFQRGKFFYLLVSGSLELAAQQVPEGEAIPLGNTSLQYAPVGWSALTSPYRYTVDVKANSDNVTVLRFEIKQLLQLASEDQDFGIAFYQFIISRANLLIEQSLEHLSKVAPVYEPASSIEPDYVVESDISTDDVVDFIRRSPFFEIFDDLELCLFSKLAARLEYRPGEQLYHQGSEKNGFYLLTHGWIDFFYESSDSKQILFRSISTAGFNVGWSGLTKGLHYASAIARQPSSVYYFDLHSLAELLISHPTLVTKFYKRLLWLVAHQLQVIRTRFITLTYDKEWIGVKTLIESHATRLDLNSDLHEIPHLLKHKHSQKRAFDSLHALHQEGLVIEKHLASLCLDNLQELEKEYNFYQGLIKIYQEVSNLPESTSKEDARKISAKATIEAFSKIEYQIDGWSNLPTTCGQIFIYNHLRNHPYNTLPNNFQVTLDSHFISGMISFQKYGDPGIRVVRVGRDVEYGHQEYYQRLGHIDVYTSESEEGTWTSDQRELTRKAFYTHAGSLLEQGRNLIISPEGTSYETHESPGKFKSGAFRLALSMIKEPLIVPIVLANFDKRARYNQYKCRIGKPFRVSEFVTDATSKSEMRGMINQIEAWYRNEIESMIDE